MSSLRDRLIVALDVPSLGEAEAVVSHLGDAVSWYKVGSELFTAAGPDAVAMVRRRGRRVFLDLKYHDIPNTVAGGVRAAARLGVDLLTLHVAGGQAMLRAAVEARGAGPMRLLGVTVLTSGDDAGGVLDAARIAQGCGLDGVVASGREAAAVKAACGPAFLVVTPGIRPEAADPGDQRRTVTPAEALRAGADYLVIGRPIVAAPDPRSAVEALLRTADAAVLE